MLGIVEPFGFLPASSHTLFIRISFVGPYDRFGVSAQCGVGPDHIFGALLVSGEMEGSDRISFFRGQYAQVFIFLSRFLSFLQHRWEYGIFGVYYFFYSLFAVPTFGDVLYCQNAK